MKTLRKEAAIDFHSALVGASFRAIEMASDPFQSCLTCINFDEPSEVCKLYKQRPPARIIVNGCPSFDDISEVPF